MQSIGETDGSQRSPAEVELARGYRVVQVGAMALPELIEIQPIGRTVRAAVTVPGSKSITNRALVLAALASGTTVLRHALWSEDTQLMVQALRVLGLEISVLPDPDEDCNRTIIVTGCGGKLPDTGKAGCLDIYVGNAGTVARFLSAFVCLGRGTYRVFGAPRMHERPQSGLFSALRALGYKIEATNDKLPAVIHGGGPRPGRCTVSITESTQFASALMLVGTAGQWTVEIEGSANSEEAGYIEMTRRIIEHFPRTGGEFVVEPDASSGTYFWGAGWLLATTYATRAEHCDGQAGRFISIEDSLPVTVKNWPKTGLQIDAGFTNYLPLPRTISRLSDLGDGIMTAIVLAADMDSGRVWVPEPARQGRYCSAESSTQAVKFLGLRRLRLQECDRVSALRAELERCGATVIESSDSLEVYPSKLHGAEIETYGDHRMAMCFSVLGLKVPGVRIKNPGCVKKTFPNFYVKLASPEPAGLGATIFDPTTNRKLGLQELVPE